MYKRARMNRHSSKKYFTHAADRIHVKNGLQGGSTAMRGGIRL